MHLLPMDNALALQEFATTQRVLYPLVFSHVRSWYSLLLKCYLHL